MLVFQHLHSDSFWKFSRIPEPNPVIVYLYLNLRRIHIIPMNQGIDACLSYRREWIIPYVFPFYSFYFKSNIEMLFNSIHNFINLTEKISFYLNCIHDFCLCPESTDPRGGVQVISTGIFSK